MEITSTITNIEDKNVNTNNILSNPNDIIKKKRSLIELSKNLTKIEYLEIFNIIQNDSSPYSENKNGIFINLENVSNETIDKIYDFLIFIRHKKEDLIKHEEYLINARKNILELQKEKEKYTETIINDNNDNNNNYYQLSDTEDDMKSNNYLVFSSDDEDETRKKNNKSITRKNKNKKV